jgi:pimeloyl-ACP methyl ester carboxylesterase
LGGEDNGQVKRAAAASIAFLALLAAAPGAQAGLRFERCGGYGFACARLGVPLDRTGAVPGRVSLLVKRIRAQRRPRKGVVFALAGGPGQSGTFAFGGDALGDLYPAYRRRDLIVFDQRGTGRSGLLRCRRLEHANLLAAGEAASDCARGLGPRRAFYTTQDSVEDLEAIRRELGAPKVGLFGTSYGTKLALAYALRYPGNVDRMVLDSVVEADGPDSLYLDTFAAVPRALRSLCRAGCRDVTPDPVGDVERLVRRLAAGPLRGRVIDSHGRRRKASLSRGDFFSVLLAGDFDPSLRAAFPGAVRSALRHDAASLLRLRRRALALDGAPPPPRALSAALYAATTCEEVRLPWARTTPPNRTERRGQAAARVYGEPESAFLPFDRLTALSTDIIGLCERWPEAPRSPDNGPGPLPDVPVLLLEGEDDLRTPIENAVRVAAQFPQAKLVVARATGHSVIGSDLSGCAARAFSRFFLGGRFKTRCGTRRLFEPLPPAPRSLAAVDPAPGVRGRRGRALTAFVETLRDVSEDSLTSGILDFDNPDLSRGGGLRGGHYRITGGGTLILRRVEYVPGVRVSGRLRRFGGRRQRGRVHVTGRATPDGILRVRGARIAGRLGGRRVRARLATSATTARATVASLPGPRPGP